MWLTVCSGSIKINGSWSHAHMVGVSNDCDVMTPAWRNKPCTIWLRKLERRRRMEIILKQDYVTHPIQWDTTMRCYGHGQPRWRQWAVYLWTDGEHLMTRQHHSLNDCWLVVNPRATGKCMWYAYRSMWSHMTTRVGTWADNVNDNHVKLSRAPVL